MQAVNHSLEDRIGRAEESPGEPRGRKSTGKDFQR